jgi:hypothetical protein
MVAILHEQGCNDAALAVLHGLAVAVHGERTGADDRAIERGERGPGAEAAEEDAYGGYAYAYAVHFTPQECSFLKKRTKKLLDSCARVTSGAHRKDQKFFCFFFFKKRSASFLTQ